MTSLRHSVGYQRQTGLHSVPMNGCQLLRGPRKGALQGEASKSNYPNLPPLKCETRAMDGLRPGSQPTPSSSHTPNAGDAPATHHTPQDTSQVAPAELQQQVARWRANSMYLLHLGSGEGRGVRVVRRRPAPRNEPLGLSSLTIDIQAQSHFPEFLIFANSNFFFSIVLFF